MNYQSYISITVEQFIEALNHFPNDALLEIGVDCESYSIPLIINKIESIDNKIILIQENPNGTICTVNQFKEKLAEYPEDAYVEILKNYFSKYSYPLTFKRMIFYDNKVMIIQAGQHESDEVKEKYTASYSLQHGLYVKQKDGKFINQKTLC